MRSGGEAVLAILVLCFLLATTWIARKTGADWSEVVAAFGKSLLPLGAAGLLVFMGSMRPITATLIALILVYPLWWPVIDSIAVNAGGAIRIGPEWIEKPWWCSSWFKWLSEVGLIGASGFYILNSRGY